MRLRLLIASCLMWPAAALAQTAALVADSLTIERDSILVAEGDVEVVYENRRLTASRVTYNAGSEELFLEGPIVLTEDDGATVVLADAAALDRDLRRGLLSSARIVLNRQLQLAAAEITRTGDRYTSLETVVASSCQVCAANPTPLWEIRADRVVHDTLERQIYFEGAQFRAAGLPLAYIPRLRLPDPTVERATGFLVPSINSSSEFGVGVRVPYFVTVGRSADVTFTPYVTGSTRTLELRYRQAFRNGGIEVEGAVSDDDLVEGPRGYVFADGAFALPRDFELSFSIEESDDAGYLLDYGYSGADRLESVVAIGRFRRDEAIRASLSNFTVLREGEVGGLDEQLRTYASAAWERRVPVPRAGGELRFGLETAAMRRDRGGGGRSSRDVSRLGANAGWHGQRLVHGLLIEGRAQLGADAYQTRNDPSYAADRTRRFARGAVALRWPLVHAGAGVHETLEPVVQLGWGGVAAGEVPNEESRLVEFDEGNLFALGRFPARDRIETGTRLDLGVSYHRSAAAGPDLRLVGGRILRFDDRHQFDNARGLDGAASDWLTAAHLRLDGGFSLADRTLFESDLSIRRNELRLAWDGARGALAAAHVWSATDPVATGNDRVNEMIFDADWRFTPRWSGAIEGRYDLAEDRADGAALGLSWRNECLRVDLSLSRRFTSSTSVGPSTDVGLEVALAGFGADGPEAAPARSCPG